jgi:SAM-dependent methyltransferase
MKLPDFLRIPETRDLNLDDPETSGRHGEIIRSKPFLRRLYEDFYRTLAVRCPDLPGKFCVELGSGGGFIKEIYPTVFTSDLLPLPGIDQTFSVLEMPFVDASVDCFLMIDVFHHVRDARKFLSELRRCLKRGGKVLMIEPANTLWGRFVYRHFHHEPFDTSGGWELEKTAPLSSANGALPWIVFCRDREIFQKEFPDLALKMCRAHTPFRYLLSGGVSMRALVPALSYPVIAGLEEVISPLNPWLGLHYTIELAKES